MNILCHLGRHKPLPSRVWNDGHFFSSCARCEKPLIRTPSSPWQEVPRNMRIVWRERTDEDITWPGHLL